MSKSIRQLEKLSFLIHILLIRMDPELICFLNFKLFDTLLTSFIFSTSMNLILNFNIMTVDNIFFLVSSIDDTLIEYGR